MKAGEFEDGTHVLRAKIDMASGNLNLRDPVIYRVRRASHHPYGRYVVYLPHVRLYPLPVGFDGGDHPLDLHH